MNKVRIYRNGSLIPAVYSGEVLDYAREADAVRPDSRPGRHCSLYASPTLPGVCRWTRAHLMMPYRRDDLETYEITVDADTTYVYDIAAWEAYSRHGKPAEDYWNTGMTLTQWLSIEGLDASNWEVLLDTADIIGTPRRVSRKRLLASGGDHMGDLEHLLKRHYIK